MKVVDWISYEEADEKEEAVGGMGGFFNSGLIFTKDRGYDETEPVGQRWKDYADTWKEEVQPYIEALKEEIVGKEIKRGGFWHQHSGEGVPVFEDGKVAIFSMRAWGDLLAAIWSEVEDKDYCYADFAWYTAEDGEND